MFPALLFFWAGMDTESGLGLSLFISLAVFSICFGICMLLFLTIEKVKSIKKTIVPSKEQNIKNDNEEVETIPNNQENKKEQKPVIYIKETLKNENLIYKYSNVKFAPNEQMEKESLEMKNNDDWEIHAHIDKTGDIILSHNNINIGHLLDRKEMVSDWLNKNDTIKIYLENYGESGNFVYLAFYRDEQKRLSGCKTSTVKLSKYANEDAQSTLLSIEENTKLDFDEDYDYNAPDDTVWITYGSSSIGTLPKNIAKKYLEEGATAVFLNHIDYDIEKDKEIPFVKIYW